MDGAPSKPTHRGSFNPWHARIPVSPEEDSVKSSKLKLVKLTTPDSHDRLKLELIGRESECEHKCAVPFSGVEGDGPWVLDVSG